MFWVQHSGETTSIKALSITTGAHYDFKNLAENQYQGAYWELVIAYDKATDKFHFWRLGHGNSTIRYEIPSITKTTMDSKGTDSNNTHETSSGGYVLENLASYEGELTDYQADQWGHGCPIGSKSRGDQIHYITDNNPYQDIYTYTWGDTASSVVFTTNNSDSQQQSYYFDIFTPSATQIAAENYTSSASLKVRASGIKET